MHKDIYKFFSKIFNNNWHKLWKSSFEDIITIYNCITGVNEVKYQLYKKKPQDDISESKN